MNIKLKRILLSITCILLLTTTLCGCSQDPKNFYADALTITLTNEFSESSMEGFDVYLVSDDVIFTAVKETENEIEQSGYEITSLNDYALQLAELNNVSKGAVTSRNSYYYFENQKTVSGGNYTYVHCMLKGADSYWVCEFVCKTKSYKRIKDDIFTWADSITIAR